MTDSEGIKFSIRELKRHIKVLELRKDSERLSEDEIKGIAELIEQLEQRVGELEARDAEVNNGDNVTREMP